MTRMHRNFAIAILAVFAVVTAAVASSQTSVLKNNLIVKGNLTVSGVTSDTGQVTFTAQPIFPASGFVINDANPVTVTAANPASARTDTIPDAGGAASFVMTTGNANGQVAKAKEVSCNIGTGSAALANGTTFTYELAAGRAGTITQVSIAAVTAPIGGTNTVAISKNGASNVLSAATFDPTTLTSNTASMPALTGTGANLTLAATDTIKVVWTTGTQATAAVAPVVTIEMIPNDY